MKKLLVTAVFALTVIGLCVPAGAEEMKKDNRYKGYPRSLIEWPKEPLDLKACQAQEFYEPSDLHLRKYAGRVKVAGVRILKSDECRWMLTRNGWRPVMRPKGTKVLIDAQGRDLFDGGSPNGKVCNNPSPFGIPIVPEPEPVAPVKPEPIKVRPTPTPIPPAVVIPPQEVVPMPSFVPPPPPPPSNNRWGLTVGAARGGYSGPIADRSLCVFNDWNLFGGVAFGDPQRLFARATFMAVLIEDGSSAVFSCPNCGTTVTVVSSGMKVLGGNIEGVLLAGKRSWKLQPTFYLGGGGGVVLGKGDRSVNNGSTQRVDAEEFFGWKTMAHGGGGAGITWHPNPDLALEGFGKYTYPYGWSVGIGLTKWLGK